MNNKEWSEMVTMLEEQQKQLKKLYQDSHDKLYKLLLKKNIITKLHMKAVLNNDLEQYELYNTKYNDIQLELLDEIESLAKSNEVTEDTYLEFANLSKESYEVTNKFTNKKIGF